MSLRRNSLAIIFFYAANCMALNTDAQQRLQINAGATLINYQTYTNTYEGDVLIKQGTTHLQADKVVTKSNAQHKIQQAIAHGFHRRAHYWTTPNPGENLLDAKADQIELYPAKSLVVMRGNVSVQQGNNSFHGEELFYNMKAQTVLSPPRKGSRTTIIIEPGQMKL